MFYHFNADHGNGNDGDEEVVVDVCHGLCQDRNLPRWEKMLTCKIAVAKVEEEGLS